MEMKKIKIDFKQLIYYIYMLLLSSTIVIGNKINVYDEPHFKQVDLIDMVNIIILMTIFSFCGKALLSYIDCNQIKIRVVKTSKRWWFISSGLLFILWGAWLFVYYPGMISPDSVHSLLQAENLDLLTNHTPIMYTLLITIFVRAGWFVGDRNFGVFLFSIVQTVIMAISLGYSVYWVKKHFLCKFLPIIVLVYFGLNPIIAIYSITMWKDILFSAWILLSCLVLIDIGISEGKELEDKKGIVRLITIFILLSFGRNNGVYIVTFVWLGLLLLFKNLRKRIIIAGGSVIFAIILIQGTGYKKLGILNSGFAESVGIPLQQISYSIKYDGPLDEKDQQFIEQILPIEVIKREYTPLSADKIKFNAQFNTSFFEENKCEFVRVYFNELPKHFKAYTKAWLLSTSGFWHIEPLEWACQFGVMDNNEMGLYDRNYINEYFNLDLRPSIQRYVINLHQKCPIYNVGLLVWIIFFYGMASVIRQQLWKVLFILPLFGCWLTLMVATPVSSQFRYVYSFHLILPIIIILLFAKRSVKSVS